MKRTLSNKSNASACRADSRSSSKTRNKQTGPAVVQYLDEQGNPLGAAIQIDLPGSSRSRSRSSSVDSSARNSIDTGSIVSRKSSMSSMSSIGSRHKTFSRRGSKSSLVATSAVIGPASQAEKPTVHVKEVKPAKFRNDQYVTERKGKCESCSGLSKGLSSMSIAKPEQISRIASRPSIEALIKEQQISKHPRPACAHDEMTLEKYDGCDYFSSGSYVPAKTVTGDLVWVFKEGSSRGWRAF